MYFLQHSLILSHFTPVLCHFYICCNSYNIFTNSSLLFAHPLHNFFISASYSDSYMLAIWGPLPTICLRQVRNSVARQDCVRILRFGARPVATLFPTWCANDVGRKPPNNQHMPIKSCGKLHKKSPKIVLKNA